MKNEMENFRHAPQLKIDVGPVSRRQPCADVSCIVDVSEKPTSPLR